MLDGVARCKEGAELKGGMWLGVEVGVELIIESARCDVTVTLPERTKR